jgi:integrase
MPRREWGTGSCYHTKRGWRVAINLGSDPFGKRIRKEWQYQSQKAAQRKLAEVQSRLARGLSAETSNVTLAAYAPEWLDTLPGRVRATTEAFYRSLAVNHLEELGTVPVARLSVADVRWLIAQRQREGYAPRTILGVLDVLRMILRQAMADGIVTRNVAELVDKPRLVQREPLHFTAAEARRFLEVTRGDPMSSLWAVALGTGLRRGELLGLTWRDIDLERATVRVTRSKTSAGVRVVPLPAFAVARLAELRRQPGPIWHYSPWWVSRHFAQVCERAGLPAIRFHGLRHTAMTLMAEAGVPIEVRRWIAGHSKTEMTAHYSHENEPAKRDAAERLGRMVG